MPHDTPPHDPPDCAEIRDLLLDHVYGALDDADAARVDAHLAACDACRDALADARRQRDVLAEAARAEAGDVTFRAPPRRDVAIFRPLFAVAAAASILVAALALAHVGSARSRETARHPVVDVSGPRTVVPGVPAVYRVAARTLDGVPLAGRFKASLPDGKGGWREVGAASLDGATREGALAIDPGTLAPGATTQLRVEADVSGAATGTLTAAFPVHEGTRLVSRVATDKPLYRPGETVRARVVALDALRLTPAGDSLVRLRILDPRGAAVFDGTLPTLSGVTAWQQTLAADAPGGTYRVVTSGVDGGTAVARSERTFQVRTFRAPRLRFDTELDRDSYRPGDHGSAMLTVKRAEGGVPAGATAEATLRVDGAVAATTTLTVGEGGGLVVPFEIPAVVEEGRASISVTVKDGGAVETTAKTVPLLVDTVRFESFPEGGTLVAGLPNRVYFRARTPADEPADLDAELRDAAGRTVAKVKADVLGMGAFDLTPAAGQTYRVVFAATGKPVGEGATLTAAPGGVTLRALDERTAARGQVPLRVGSTQGGTYTVGAWCRGVQVGDARIDVAPGRTADVRLPIRTEAGGVLRVTVFDPAGTPVAERLVAREAPHRLDVTVTPDRAKSAPRERVTVSVAVRDEDGRPAQTILGASVADASMLALADDRDTAPLPLHFLLGMEVRDIEEVARFEEGPGAALATDRLLGVQGWRRFAWRDAKAFAAAHPDEADAVAAVGADEAPNRWTNETSARAAVASAASRAGRQSREGAAACALVGLFLAGVWVGVRGLVAKRRGIATAGFAVCGLYLLVATSAVVVPTMGERHVQFAADAAAPMAVVGTGGAGDRLRIVFNTRDEPVAEGEAPVDRLSGLTEATGGPADKEAVAAALRRVLELKEDQAKKRFDDVDLEESVLDAIRDGAYTPAADARGGMLEKFDGLRAGFVAERDVRLDPEWRKSAARVLVREYAHRAAPAAAGARADFTDVLYWNPLLVTDEGGRASFEFDTSDAITAFRVDVEGHDGRGALGDGTAEFSNRVPFYAEPKFPAALTAGDEVDLPVVVANDGAGALDVTASVAVDGTLLAPRNDTTFTAHLPPAPATAVLHVAPETRGRALVPLVALQGRGPSSITVTASAGNLIDRSTRTIDVLPRGFPIVADRSGVLEKEDSATFVLPDRLDRVTLRGGLRLYPSMLSTLVDGLDGMLREPGGCFEQASSTNYPNVMVLAYLDEQGAAAPDVARRAKDLLASGYKLLTGYECSRKGYEWFGSDPGHEALTAYGLLEFADMAKVFPVDGAMVARTRDWLMSRRDGKGGYLRDAKALDSFGAAPAETTDAYVTWALSEADATGDLAAELDALERRARDADDPYVVALAANALENRRRPAAGPFLARLASMQRADGGFDAKTRSITSSTGVNLEVETTALAVLAFAKHPAHLGHAEAGVRFLLAHRTGGSFGATQATILALRALTAHAKASKRTASDHDITILVDDVQVATRFVPKGAAGVIEIGPEVLAALHPGENRVTFRTTGAEALPWSFRVEYSTSLPASDPACAVDVTTALDRGTAREGETVDLAVTVRNRTDEGQPMTLARVGVPAGLDPRAERLDELRKAGAIDFFELRPLEVVLYWRGLAPKAELKVVVELTATIPGRFEGPASSAYLYYSDDRKTWAAPLRCAVE